ncbi:MAG: C1 family peptidase [Chitinophagaceae bacterium]
MRRLLFPFLLLAVQFCKGQTLSSEELGLLAPVINNCTPVKDQYMSSTCWSFASNSLLESELLKKGKNIDLSEMFVARYSLLRKIHRHLQLKGANFFTPGGQFHDVLWVLKNHGIVPEAAYPGKGRGEFNHNHAEMDTVLSHFVKELVSKGIVSLDREQQFFVDSVLDHYMGKLPLEFLFRGTVYTPQRFLETVMEFDPDDFVEITSYTHHPFYKAFVLEDKYNWTGDAYYNVPLEDFSRITDQALANGFTVGWDGDATDEYFDFYKGLAYLPGIIPDQLARQKSFNDQSTSLDHMMHIVAVTTDKTGNKWYYVKNSWGNKNPLGGYLFMREDYFKIRTVAIIINKNAIPGDIRGKLGL